jgi:hypothetical protein
LTGEEVDETKLTKAVGGIKERYAPPEFRRGEAEKPRLCSAVDLFCWLLVIVGTLYRELPLKGIDHASTSYEKTRSITGFFQSHECSMPGEGIVAYLTFKSGLA